MQLVVFIETVNRHTVAAAAQVLGISAYTADDHLKALYREIGAVDRTHAAMILWPMLGDALLPHVQRAA